MLAPRIAPPPVEWLDMFLRSSHRRQYPAKTTIVHDGDPAETLFYIISGSVCVDTESPSQLKGLGNNVPQKELVLAYLHAGEFFGEMGLFEQEGKRSARVVARTKCEVAEMNYEQFRRLAADQPDMLYALTTQMAARLRHTSSKVGDMMNLQVRERVAVTLLDLAHMPDAITHPDGMQIRITRQEIARIVGCSREMVGRVLKELENPPEGEPLIHARGKTMVIYGTR